MCITEDVKNSYKFPFGTEGREMLVGMNEHHAPVTTWTLELMEPQSEDIILDIGCGGGRALKRVSSLVKKGKLYGADYSETSVQCTIEENAADVASGKLTVVQASVSDLPFETNMFDKVYSIESYFFWPDLENDIKEILRVLKPGGKVFIASNVQTEALSEKQQAEIEMLHMHIVSSEAFEKLMKDVGYCNVKVYEQDGGRQVCAVGVKPM